jgi:DNA polymerase III epsilon subunit-like protein
MKSHNLEQIKGGHRCTVCLWTWTRYPQSRCPGIPRYARIPDHLKTFTQLGKLGLKPQDREQPDGCYYRWSDRTFIFLYDVENAVQKRKETEAQKQARQKSWLAIQERYRCPKCGRAPTYLGDIKDFRPDGHLCEECYQWQCYEDEQRELEEMIKADEREACQWAAAILQTDNFVILDTETTDLYGYLVELAVIDKTGTFLFHSLINPQAPIDPQARAIHGITDEELATAPTLPEIWEQFLTCLDGKTTIITYNADFDRSTIYRDAARYNLPLPKVTWQCLMHKYAQYYGEYSEYWQSYKWQPLPYGSHRATGDAQAALHLLHSMAQYFERLNTQQPAAENTMVDFTE